jgi:hypothetical protein
MNVNDTRKEVERLQVNADDKRKQAQVLSEKSSNSEAIGDSTGVEIARREAEKMASDAEQLAQAAAEKDQLALELERRAQDINRQQEELDKQHKSEMDRLEREKNALRGTIGSIF